MIFLGKVSAVVVPRGWVVIYKLDLPKKYKYVWRLVNYLGYAYDFTSLEEGWNFFTAHFHYLEVYIHTGYEEPPVEEESGDSEKEDTDEL